MKKNFTDLFRGRGYDEDAAVKNTNFLIKIPVVSNMNSQLLVDAFSYYQILDRKDYSTGDKYIDNLDPASFAADMEKYMIDAGWKPGRDVNFEELKTSFLRYLNIIDDQYPGETILGRFFEKYM